MQTYKFIIKGLVQGVFYRKTIHDKANTLNIKGQVKNLFNGDVEVYANLTPNNFDIFISVLKEGSHYSNVSGVTSSKMAKKTFTRFSVTYS